MTVPAEVVFLFDVDNTLLDNDRIEKDLRQHIEHEFGVENSDRYFAILEELRAELSYTDYLGTLQRYRLLDMCDSRLLMLSAYLVDYPFANRLYPGSLDALGHARAMGKTVILSDGERSLPTPEGSTVGTMGNRRGPGVDLHTQGTDAGQR